MHLILTTRRSTQLSGSTPHRLKGTLPHGHFRFKVFGQENSTGPMGSYQELIRGIWCSTSRGVVPPDTLGIRVWYQLITMIFAGDA